MPEFFGWRLCGAREGIIMEKILLIIHIATGSISIFSGFLALFTRKGSLFHIASGRIFSIAILITGGAIIGLGIFGGSIDDVLGGLTLLYFVVTAWRTLQFPKLAINTLDYGLFICVLGLAMTNTILGLKAKTLSLEYPSTQYFLIALIHLIAVVDDLYLLMKRRAVKKYCLIRHAWRMCLVLFMASGSLFLGQMRIFPAMLIEHSVFVFFIPPLLPLLFMGYWVIRINIKRSQI